MKKNVKNYYSNMHLHYVNSWGGSAIHVGIYDDPNISATEAMNKSMDHLTELAQNYSETSIKSSTILDLGSGFGCLCRHIARITDKIIFGVDISRTNKERHRHINEKQGIFNINIINGSSEKLDFDNEVFDMAFSQDAIVHSFNKKSILRN